MDVNVQYSIGNIKTQTIDEIFDSREMYKLRDSLEKNISINNICANCSFFIDN